MKRLAALLLVSALAVGMLAGCGNNNAKNAVGNEDEIEELEVVELDQDDAGEEGTTKGEGSTFTVGFDAEYPPFGYMDDNGEYVGFDLDVAQLVCDNLGWELVKIFIAFLIIKMIYLINTIMSFV